jgi:uncharacterized membrane protein (DUF4010 family)
MTAELDPSFRLLAAALGGAAVGIEREWSGHAAGRIARIGGVRTFTLLGGLAGLAGLLATTGQTWPATVLIAAAGGLVVVGYMAASHIDRDGTTEVAALVVLGAGVLAGIGGLQLASGVIAVTCVLLVEKSRLHAFVERLDDVELRAGAHFAVLAIVVLPLLPEGPFGPLGGIQPRSLWMLVLLFSGLSFVGYVARRAVGPHRGYVIAGLLGGMVSSTGVTLTLARNSRTETAHASMMVSGVVAACTVMFVRVLVALAVLQPALAWVMLPTLVLPALVGGGLVALSRRYGDVTSDIATSPPNPLQLRNALQMAALFQAVLMIAHAADARWGETGLLGTGALSGLTDVDALTIAMASSVDRGTPVVAAARAVAIGAVVNTILKSGIVVVLGAPRFRLRAALALLVLAAVTVLAVLATLGWAS